MGAPPDDRADEMPPVGRTRIGIAGDDPPSGETTSTGTLPSAGTPIDRPSTPQPPGTGTRHVSGERMAVRMPPPAFVALKGEVLEHSPPRLVRVRYPVEEWTLNPYGAVQDGFLAAMIDNVVSILAYATDPLRPSSKLELSVRYFRAIRAGHVTVDGAVLRAGRTTVTLECLVWDDGSELCAKATATNLFVG